MRKLIVAAMIAAFLPLILSGCGGAANSQTTTGAPAPLTDEQKAEIKTLDQQIDADEQGDQYNPKKKRK